MNNDALDFFRELSNKNLGQKSVKLAKNADNSHIDASFVLKYADKTKSILDLGTGTGLMVNKIFDNVKKLVCVEPYKEFSKYIINNENIFINNVSAFDFSTDEKFDLITMFGFIQYFDENETTNIYKKYITYLKPNGKFIVKSQFGLNEDVTVRGYSEEQKTDYYSQYRFIKKEENILKSVGFNNVEIFDDIYPEKANRWNNTRFYAIVASI